MADNPDYDVSDSELSDQTQSGPKPKRRRLHGACDTCRKKKIKCDSAIMPNNICSNCLNTKVQCTHNIPRQKKKDTQLEYIRTLEDRLRKMEDLLRMSPPSDSSKSVSTPESFRETSPSAGSDIIKIFPDRPLVPVPRSPPDMSAESPSSVFDDTEDDEDDLSHVALSERLKKLKMHSITDRFFGRSSLFSFAKQAVEIRNEANGDPGPCNFLPNRRDYFWGMRQWEEEYVRNTPHPPYVFPDPDLLDSLVTIFFTKVHSLYPAVHQQTFERGVRNNEHVSNPQFGMVVLAVCALASRYSDDPRVFLEPSDGQGIEGSSAGWKYIIQVPFWRNSLCDRTSVYDLQFYALTAIYFVGTAMPQVTWNIVGLGLRLAQEMGLHRRTGRPKPTVEELAATRTFWCLIATDRLVSSFLGRTPALHDEDIDCDYPIECDDEYWETPNPKDAFKQPPGQPCRSIFVTHHLKLCEIIGFMSRTLYSTKKSQILSGLIGPEWETRVVTELDSSLNKWKDALPQHLVWDPSNPDPLFFLQSLVLHCTFQYVQIQVHRPFLGRKDSLALSSLAICTNAARACSQAAAMCVKRGAIIFPNVTTATFLSAMILTVHFWSSRQTKVTYDLEREIADIERCRDYMTYAETRWYVAGRLRDMITEFGLKGGSAFAQAAGPVSPQSNKRSRHDDQPTYIEQLSQFAPSPSNLGSATPYANVHDQSPFTNQFVPARTAPISNVTLQTGQHQFTPSFITQPQNLNAFSSGRSGQQPLQAAVAPPFVTGTGMNDLDLSSLMLAQLGYFHSPGSNFNPMAFSPRLQTQTPYGTTRLTGPIDAYDDPFGAGATPKPSASTPVFARPTMVQQQTAGGPQFDPYDVSNWMSDPQAFSSEYWESYFASSAQV